MIVLDSTVKSVTVVMSAAATTTQPDFTAAYSDDTGSAFTEGSNDGTLNGTTSVTLVSAPSSSTRRLVKSIYITNTDSVAVGITVYFNNNGTLRTIAKVTLAVGDTWSLDGGVVDSNGNTKTASGSPTAVYTGTAANLAAVFTNAAEVVTVSGSGASGTVTYYIATQSVLYYTGNASGNFTLDFKHSSSTSLNSALSTGQSVTITFLNTNGGTAYYPNTFKVDGTTVTPKWSGGNAPSSGNASSVDAYIFTIIKTGSATYTILAAQSKYA